MINPNEIFALENENENVQIPPNFIGAIHANRGTLRQSRCLCIGVNELVWLNGQDDGYILVEAPGGGMVTWYLCRYEGNLHFVFQSYTGNQVTPYTYSARETSRNEVDDLLYSFGGGIINVDGYLQQYDTIAGPQPVPQYHLEFDFDALLPVYGHRIRTRSNDEQDDSFNFKRVNRTQ